MSCCTETMNLGCFSPCDCVLLPGLVADQAGTWRFEYNYGIGGSFTASLKTFAVDDPLYVPGDFNENATVELRIFRPDGTRFTYLQFDCFTLKFSPKHDKGTYVNCRTLEERICTCIFTIAPLEEQTGGNLYAFQISPDVDCNADIFGYRITFNGQSYVLSGRSAVLTLQTDTPGTKTVTVVPQAYGCIFNALTFDFEAL